MWAKATAVSRVPPEVGFNSFLLKMRPAGGFRIPRESCNAVSPGRGPAHQHALATLRCPEKL